MEGSAQVERIIRPVDFSLSILMEQIREDDETVKTTNLWRVWIQRRRRNHSESERDAASGYEHDMNYNW